MSKRSLLWCVTLLVLCAALLPVYAVAGCHVLAVSSISPTDPNGGGANNVQITTSATGVPATLNREGLVERLSDVLIFDDTAVAGGNCFVNGNVIRLNYNLIVTNPTSLSLANLDFYDSHYPGPGLGIQISLSSTLAPAQTMITITVAAPGTAATGAGGITANPTGSALRIKNLRADATSLDPGANAIVVVSANNGMPGSQSVPIGLAQNTIAPGAGVTQQGSGTQSSGGTLDTPAIFSFAENFGNAFRVAAANASGVFNDNPTNATSLIFDFGTSIPSGVTVTFPSTIETSFNGGAAGIIFKLRSGGACNGSANCVAIYDTIANGPLASSVTITTSNVSNNGADGTTPALGVAIGNTSGFGTANLTVSFGPAASAGTGNDDVSANAIPRYVSSNTTSTAITRFVLGTAKLAVNASGPQPLPTVTSISPNSAAAGTPGLTLTVNGTNFASNSIVEWNGSTRVTTFVNNTQLTAAIPGSDLANAGTASVTVLNPSGGGGVSNAAIFSIGATALPSSSFLYVLPHAVQGGGFVTRITVVNTSNVQNSITVNFISQSGAVIQSTTSSLAPGGTLRVATSEAARFGGLTTEWAAVGSQSPALVNELFEFIPSAGGTVTNAVGFNDSPPLTDFSFPVEFQTPPAGQPVGKTVGLALANPTAGTNTATLRLVDSAGNVIATLTVNLPAFGQVALDLGQNASFKAALPSGNFVGSVTVSGTSPLSAIGLEDVFGLFAATPVGPGRAR